MRGVLFGGFGFRISFRREPSTLSPKPNIPPAEGWGSLESTILLRQPLNPALRHSCYACQEGLKDFRFRAWG